MTKRIIFGVLGAIIAVSIFLYADLLVIGVIVGAIIMLALYEFFRTIGYTKDKKILVLLSYLYAISITATFITERAASNRLMPPIMFMYTVLLLLVMVLNHKKLTFGDAATAFLGTNYITLFLSCIYLISALPNGRMYIWIPFIIAWLTDTFAYFTGVFFGKTKLIPGVSPKKTVEGALGGVAGAVVSMMVYMVVCKYCFGAYPKFLMGAVLAFVCSCASQVGDLAASCIKREHGAKDFGSIMPGHGGVLDRFDSVIYIAPVVYYFLTGFGIFG